MTLQHDEQSVATNDDVSALAATADRLLTVEETAERLGQKPQWVRAHQDELPRVELPGRTVRFSSRRLEQFIKRRSQG